MTTVPPSRPTGAATPSAGGDEASSRGEQVKPGAPKNDGPPPASRPFFGRILSPTMGAMMYNQAAANAENWAAGIDPSMPLGADAGRSPDPVSAEGARSPDNARVATPTGSDAAGGASGPPPIPPRGGGPPAPPGDGGGADGGDGPKGGGIGGLLQRLLEILMSAFRSDGPDDPVAADQGPQTNKPGGPQFRAADGVPRSRAEAQAHSFEVIKETAYRISDRLGAPKGLVDASLNRMVYIQNVRDRQDFLGRPVGSQGEGQEKTLGEVLGALDQLQNLGDALSKANLDASLPKAISVALDAAEPGKEQEAIADAISKAVADALGPHLDKEVSVRGLDPKAAAFVGEMIDKTLRTVVEETTKANPEIMAAVEALKAAKTTGDADQVRQAEQRLAATVASASSPDEATLEKAVMAVLSGYGALTQESLEAALREGVPMTDKALRLIFEMNQLDPKTEGQRIQVLRGQLKEELGSAVEGKYESLGVVGGAYEAGTDITEEVLAGIQIAMTASRAWLNIQMALMELCLAYMKEMSNMANKWGKILGV